MATKFFTNKENNTLFDKFKGILAEENNYKHFDILVGYLRSSGYFKLREFIPDNLAVRILVGINVDKLIAQKYAQGLEFRIDDDEVRNQYKSTFREEIQTSDYSSDTDKSIHQFIEDIKSQRVQMKAHPSKNIHAKLFILAPENYNPDSSSGQVIMGSSNLTSSGLGIKKESNYEFNVNLRDFADVKFASDEFEALWAEGVNVLSADIDEATKDTYLPLRTPFELYIKLLIEYFGNRIEYDNEMKNLLPKKYKPLQYQNDAAITGYQIMMKHNGFFLADVVGLGKTIVACLIAKKFIWENGLFSRVLVVYPPALETNRKETVDEFGIRSQFDFISTGMLDKILDTNNHDYQNADVFDLVIVDESHKFRNQDTDMYEQLQHICKTDRKNIGSDNNRRKKVMLLSATPMNNTPADIESQLYLFKDKRNSKIAKVPNLEEFFSKIKKKYKVISKDLKELPAENSIEKEKLFIELKALFEKVRKDVIQELVVRRTRTDIMKDDKYREDLIEQFGEPPVIKEPNEVHYTFDSNLTSLFKDTVAIITATVERNLPKEPEKTKSSIRIVNGKTQIQKSNTTPSILGYYRYRAIEYLVNEDDRARYGGKQVESISDRLAAIMKTLLIKRLESSFDAFKKSLSRMRDATGYMLTMFDRNEIYIAPDLNINKLMEDEDKTFVDIEEIIKAKGGTNAIYKKSAFSKDFVQLLKQDKKILDGLVDKWAEIDYDPKLIKFLYDIDNNYFDKKTNQGGKLVIFSESKETVAYLKENLVQHGRKDVLAIDSSNREKKKTIISENFDANYTDSPQKDDKNIIITTEVLAEGINLHRSNIIINYDVPWNSTRLMQRIVRINRLGTKAKEIYIYNYYPSSDSEEKIKLSATAIRKLQAFHTAFGEDSQIYSKMEEIAESGLFDKDSKEDTNEYNDLLIKVREFKKENEEEFNRIKTLSDKSRCMRKYKNVPSTDRNINGSTIAYLKTETHPGVFYLVDTDENIQELGIIEAAQILEAEQSEKPFTHITKQIPKYHYKQVNIAVDKFIEDQNKHATQNQASSKTLNQSDKKALDNLKFINRSIGGKDKELLDAIAAIENGTYKSLSKELAKYFKANTVKASDEYVKRLKQKVLNKYRTGTSINEDLNDNVEMPQIILSETIIEKP